MGAGAVAAGSARAVADAIGFAYLLIERAHSVFWQDESATTMALCVETGQYYLYTLIMPARRAKPPGAAGHQSGLTLSPCTEEYWEFVRLLRTDHRVRGGFIAKVDDITPEQQRRYMQAHWQEYFIGLVNGQPAGYVGSVDGDIRVCTHPDYQRQGVAAFMIAELMRRFPRSFAKIKIGNEASERLFAACGFKPTFVIYEKPDSN
jgi:RimJ/RimL family protein N-acetyltransferase